MSKGLECLKRIDERNYITEREHKEFLKVVEQALLRLEAIDNTNPSEALECLEEIKDFTCPSNRNECVEDYFNNYSNIKQALIKSQDLEKRLKDLNTRYMDYVDKSTETIGKLEDNLIKEEQENIKLKKVLEILFEKQVDVYMLFDLGLEEYNKWVLQRYGTYYQLTQEEFDLLKEVFKDE